MLNRIFIRSQCINGLIRFYSTKSNPPPKPELFLDRIGPPDIESNLRPISFAKPENETYWQKRYRQAREDTQRWNQEFWRQQNMLYRRERDEFVAEVLAQGKPQVTNADMARFHTQFADRHWAMQFDYNRDWYHRNIKLLFLNVAANISKYIPKQFIKS